MLSEIEEAIRQVRLRRNELIRIRDLLDEEQVPEMMPVVDCESICSRTTKGRSVHAEEPCTFTPSISSKSRKLATKRPRDPVYMKTEVKKEQVSEPVVKSVSAVTEAIANRIRKTYGSLDEYHRQRRENALLYKDVVNRKETEELKECTFHPHVTDVRKGPDGDVKVTGLESFLKRLQKARELRTKEEAESAKPGSGRIYTGEPTKVEPFSFLNRRARIRE